MFINGYLQNNNTSAVSLFNSPYVYTYGIEVYTDIGIDMHTNIYIQIHIHMRTIGLHI